MNEKLTIYLLLMVAPIVEVISIQPEVAGILDLTPVSMSEFSADGKTEIRGVSVVLIKAYHASAITTDNRTIKLNVAAKVADHDIVSIKTQNKDVDSGSVKLMPVQAQGINVVAFSTTFNLQLEADMAKMQHTVTGNLTAEFTITTDLDPDLCKGGCIYTHTVYNETRRLNVTSSANTTRLADGLYQVTVNVLKSLDTLSDLRLNVTLVSTEEAESKYIMVIPDVILEKTKTNQPVNFNKVPAGEYSVKITCAKDCNGLQPWINFTSVPTIAAHEQLPVLSKELEHLKEVNNDLEASNAQLCCLLCTKIKNASSMDNKCRCSNDWINHNCASSPNDIPTASSHQTKSTTVSPSGGTSSSATEPSPSDETNPSPSDETNLGATEPSLRSSHYMELAVGGLIAVLVLSLLGYLLYHYRVQVKEWVCSNKNAVSNLSRPSLTSTLRRARGGRYTKLPRTMQEALHQD